MAASAIPFHRWHRLLAPKAAAEALVLISCGPADLARAPAFAARWARVVPRCAFAGFEALQETRRIAFAPVQEIVKREARALDLALSQIVMIGAGRAGQHALDLVLCNALPDVHVIVVDLPPEGVVVSFPPAQGGFRFVQHRRADDPQGRQFDQTIHALREACLDIRTVIMPDDLGATERAIGTFLVELVARASRDRPSQPSESSATSRIEDLA